MDVNGKSTIVEEFARREYDSYILIDFARTSNEVKTLFETKNKENAIAKFKSLVVETKSLKQSRKIKNNNMDYTLILLVSKENNTSDDYIIDQGYMNIPL